jgi:hypothetical protein
MVKEGEYGANTVYTYCINGNIISVEIFPGIEGGEIEENGGES